MVCVELMLLPLRRICACGWSPGLRSARFLEAGPTHSHMSPEPHRRKKTPAVHQGSLGQSSAMPRPSRYINPSCLLLHISHAHTTSHHTIFTHAEGFQSSPDVSRGVSQLVTGVQSLPSRPYRNDTRLPRGREKKWETQVTKISYCSCFSFSF